MNATLTRALNVEWSGILAAIVLGGVALAIVSPAFLTEFNQFVLMSNTNGPSVFYIDNLEINLVLKK